ncbi:MAG: ABC transporter permease [Acidimicrobiales bacterium]|jgi:peptide/nickel transport system permease protein|nr:ABC transporter permease [Acidimicrobiales bacterium]
MRAGLVVLRRLGETLLTVFLMVTIVFFLLRVVGDPAELLVAPEATHADLDKLRAQLGLDRPLLEQYVDYMRSVVTFDFGRSLTQNRGAGELVGEAVRPTLELTGLALLIGVPVSIILGSIAALRRGGIVDTVTTAFATLGRAMPSFWLGLMLIITVAVGLRWLPASGYGTFQQLILPSVTLSMIVIADVTRLTRSSLLEAYGNDYVRTAYAKGAGPARVTWFHVFRNAMVPVITIIGLRTAVLISGSIVVESVFAVPGLGWLLIRAINRFDFPVVQATIILIGFLVIATSLLVDIAYVLIDPRSRSVRRA